ncbi:MAG TPA: hypothetical protein VFX11_03780 [Candidatus Kapabacteria bacterium]|nr:hypothetical protein [Candidatus Kapabacteria bacterium]
MKVERIVGLLMTAFMRASLKWQPGLVVFRGRGRADARKWRISQRGAVKAMSLLMGLVVGLMLLPAINQAGTQRLEEKGLVAAGARPAPVPAGLTAMDDSEMAQVNGQALFMSSHERNVLGTTTYDFYKMGLDAQLDLNVNIAELKLGEDTSGVDLWIKNLAMGCIGATASPTTADCIVAGSGTTETGKVLKPFTLLRPFVQIAVKGDNAATREVVGIRLGAQNAQGPFSAGNFNSFSGYMSGTAALQMQGQGNDGRVGWYSNGGNPSGCTNNMCTGVALTNDSDFRVANTRWDHLNQSQLSCASTSVTNTGCAGGYNFGFNNQYVDAGITGANTRTLLVGFNTVNANGNVVASGSRLSQALVSGLNLANVVGTLGDSVSVKASTSLGSGLLNTFLPFLIGQVKTDLKNQLATGLGITYTGNVSDAALNGYKMPFNLENFHSTMVDSSLFGLSFQKESVQYPGYAVAMQKGWSMYLPNAFALNIAGPTTLLVSNIVSSNSDTAGNITGLPANAGGRVYDNCWGTSVFC